MDAVALFNKTSLECSKLITQNYSTSFTIGIKLMDKKYHAPIYAIYGFLRFGDEIVDTFLESDKKTFLDKFKKDTFEAIDNKLSFNPVLHAFQLIVNKYKIGKDPIEAFFRSMEMDLDFKTYDDTKYREYIYGSAEVVGLMCLRVFCEGDDDMFQRLNEHARKLGSALQKVNFLRDIKSDYEERGRVYFPGVDYHKFDSKSKTDIEKDIQKDFDQGLVGINQLPEGARSGVCIAYVCFYKLFQKIKSLPPDTLKQKRIRLSNFQKLLILLSENFLYFILNIMIISVPLANSFDEKINYFEKWYALFPAISLTAAFFISWDIIFTRRGIWRFNSRYLIGVKMLGLPIEEWMFFFTVPYSCIFIYESLKYYFPQNIFQPLAKPFFYLIIFIISITGLYKHNKTYTWTNSLIAVGMILIHFYVFEDRLLGRFLFALIIHYIPFLICNGILTGGWGMREPVVLYNEQTFSNLRIGTIPIEDTIYSMSLLLMNVSLYEWFQNYFANVT